METHTSVLAWKMPWTEEPGGRAMESMRLKTYDLMTKNNNLALACVKKKIYHEDENSGERLGSLQESP